jgi:hypothetical protein
MGYANVTNLAEEINKSMYRHGKLSIHDALGDLYKKKCFIVCNGGLDEEDEEGSHWCFNSDAVETIFHTYFHHGVFELVRGELGDQSDRWNNVHTWLTKDVYDLPCWEWPCDLQAELDSGNCPAGSPWHQVYSTEWKYTKKARKAYPEIRKKALDVCTGDYFYFVVGG